MRALREWTDLARAPARRVRTPRVRRQAAASWRTRPGKHVFVQYRAFSSDHPVHSRAPHRPVLGRPSLPRSAAMRIGPWPRAGVPVDIVLREAPVVEDTACRRARAITCPARRPQTPANTSLARSSALAKSRRASSVTAAVRTASGSARCARSPLWVICAGPWFAV